MDEETLANSSEIARRAIRDPNAPALQPRKRKGPGRKIRRNAVARAERMVRIAAMFADDKTLTQIAGKVGISAQQVSNDIDAYIRKLDTQSLEALSKRVSRSEAVFRAVQLEATIAWYESKEGRVVHNYKRAQEIRADKRRRRITRAEIERQIDEAFGPGPSQETVPPDVENIEEYERTESSAGDPQFLRIAMECEREIIRLRKLIPKDGEGQLWSGVEGVRRLSHDERVTLLARFKEKAQLKKAQMLALNRAPDHVIDVELTPAPGNYDEEESEELSLMEAVTGSGPIKPVESPEEEDDSWLP